MVKIKNALYACAGYVVSIVALYGFAGSVAGDPSAPGVAGSELPGSGTYSHHGRDLRGAITVASKATSLKGGRGHGAEALQPFEELETEVGVKGIYGPRTGGHRIKKYSGMHRA